MQLRVASAIPQDRAANADRLAESCARQLTRRAGPAAREVPALDAEPLSELELRELEGVLEQHRRKLNRIDPGYGVFMSLCVPRLLATIRQLQRDLGEVRNERDDARALLHNLTG
ncbi:MAG TPA: hypothetical protein VF973_04765 [Myxococcales bacterium]